MGDTAINTNSSSPSVNLGADDGNAAPSGSQGSTQASKLYPDSTHSYSVLEYLGFFFHHASGGEQKKLAMKAAQGQDVSPADIEKADKLQAIGAKATEVQAKAIALGAAAAPSGGPIVGETAANLVIGKVADSATDPAGSFPGGESDKKETIGTKPADTPPPNLPTTPPPTTPTTFTVPPPPLPPVQGRPFDEKLYQQILLQLQKSYEPKKPEPPKPPEPKKKGKIQVTLSEPDSASKNSGTSTK